MKFSRSTEFFRNERFQNKNFIEQFSQFLLRFCVRNKKNRSNANKLTPTKKVHNFDWMRDISDQSLSSTEKCDADRKKEHFKTLNAVEKVTSVSNLLTSRPLTYCNSKAGLLDKCILLAASVSTLERLRSIPYF